MSSCRLKIYFFWVSPFSNVVGPCGANGPCVRQTVWSWPSLLRSSPGECGTRVNRRGAGDYAGVREARKNSAPGERGISRPTIAQGRPCVGLHLYAAVRFSACAFAQRTAGAAGTRPSLHPLGYEGGAITQSSGELSRENAKACLEPHTGAPSPGLTGRPSIPRRQ